MISEHIKVSFIASVTHEINRSLSGSIGEKLWPKWVELEENHQESMINCIKSHLNAIDEIYEIHSFDVPPQIHLKDKIFKTLIKELAHIVDRSPHSIFVN